ncbi:MAG: DUF4365 domain-containing protein [Candidatus Lokiarchaeota archaeon]|nr:DUF4365 domain-containing protein [Candidatus Lokiarchaeota archaeon]
MLYNNVEHIGINKVAAIVVEDFKWIFRQQPTVDLGIDAQIEIVDDLPTGKLIALQIKSGKSYFKHANIEGFFYYGTKRHLEYWLNHSLPVFLIIYDPENTNCYWQHITNEKIHETNSGWKTFIQYSQQFDIKAKKYIYNILMKESVEAIKFKQLIYNIDLLKYLKQGNNISVYTEDYINKSYKRGITKIILTDKNENEIIERDWFGFHGLLEIEDIMDHYFPWADYELDHDFYEINFDEPSIKSILGFIDYDDIYPYEILGSEIACYRFKLELNSLGKSFLEVMSYIYS